MEATAVVDRLSIYKAARSIKRRENSLYNALRSIYEDSVFVAEIATLWPVLPLVANLRCGLWYSPRFHSSCYFKSTDGHANNWAFSTSRLNLHVAHLAGQTGGCIIVDSTRKGKRFPDSMSKTIPIWACVLNRAIKKYLHRVIGDDKKDGELSNISSNKLAQMKLAYECWDSSLHLPLWVLETEKASIEEHLEGWTKQLEACGADVVSLALTLMKPLRPLWISQRSIIWLNEVPSPDSWNFTPLILVSASASDGITRLCTSSEFSWHYISGAGDDEESWARGLSPKLFWKHVYDLIDSGPDVCNQKVAVIVERERVYHSQRDKYCPQVTIKTSKFLVGENGGIPSCSECIGSDVFANSTTQLSSDNKQSIYWIGSTSLAVSSTTYAPAALADSECVLNCAHDSDLFCASSSDSYFHLPIASSKLDRFSLMKNLPLAIGFAKSILIRGKKLIVRCQSGEDISICVCLAILIFLFDDRGSFDSGESFIHKSITKFEIKRTLVFICKFATNARPSRGNLKQVFGFLLMEKERMLSLAAAVDGV